MKQKAKFLIPFLIFVTVITLGMSGLYMDLYNSLSDFFGGEEETEELMVQKVYAYNALSLQQAIESVGSVNILDLTLANDITYEGKCLKAGTLSTIGSSAFYVDINGHNLDIKTDTSGGISMHQSTFYAVDTVGGGHIDIDSKGGGILCKNFVVEGGNISVQASGSNLSTNDSENKDSTIDSEDVDADILGDYFHSQNWGTNDPHFNNATFEGVLWVDAIRSYHSVNIHAGGTVVATYKFDGHTIPDYGPDKQLTFCGVRAGDPNQDAGNPLCNMTDGGEVIIDGGTLIATGPTGIFSNIIKATGGTIKAYGSCGNSSGGTDFYGYKKEAIVFSDPHGFDGHFYIGPNATVYASVPTATAAIFSYCCEKFECEGTLYSGCREGYFDANGKITMKREDEYSDAFYNQPHMPGESYGMELQRSAIEIGSGDVIFSGASKAYLYAHGLTIAVGQDYKGIWAFGADGVSNAGATGNNVGAGDINQNSWTKRNIAPDFNTGHVYSYLGGSVTPWISSQQWARIEAKHPSAIFTNTGAYDPKVNTNYIFDMSFKIAHSGTYTQNGGALVLARSFGTSKETSDYDLNSAALFVSGGTGKSGNDYAINIEGTNTEAYFHCNEIGILTNHAQMRVASNAYVSCYTDYGPERPRVTNDGGGNWQGEPVLGTYCIKEMRDSQCAASYGGTLLVESGGKLKCHATGGSSGFSIGIEASNGLTAQSGGAIDVVVDSNGTGSSTQHNYSMGIHSWGDIKILSGAKVESTAGSTALRHIYGNLTISGDNPYCKFVSRGGQFDHDNKLGGWGQNIRGPLSSGAYCNAYISGGTVECSIEGTNVGSCYAIDIGNILEIFGNAKVKCSNAGVGIHSSENDVKIYGNATVDISNVDTGIKSTYTGISWISNDKASTYIYENAKVDIQAKNNGIVSYYGVDISGNPSVSIKSTTDTAGASGILAEKSDVNIALDKEGTVSVYYPDGEYGIRTAVGNVNISKSGNIVAEGKTAGIYSASDVNISVTGKDSYVNSSGNEYGIRSGAATKISGPGTEDVYKFSNVIASGNGTNGIGIYAGTTFNSSSCTLNASGTKHGINSGDVLTIGDRSTVDAVSTSTTECAVKSSSSVKISPYASVKAVGINPENHGSVSPAPISTFNNQPAYVVKFCYATVDTYERDSNGNIDVTTRDYKNEYFKYQLYYNTKSEYSTLASKYQSLENIYSGVGHTDENLYIYLPAGSYWNTVTAYDIQNNKQKFVVDFGAAGYNKVDNSGELLFNAYYKMDEYTNFDKDDEASNSFIASPNVISKNIDVYPLIPYSLETFKIYDSQGNELKDGIKDANGNLLSNSDGDEYFTWSEVKYYIENIATGAVDVKILGDSLAFSTITVPSGVTVNIYTEETNGVKLFRGTFDRNLHSHMEGIYVSTLFNFDGTKDSVLLPGYTNILKFYSPSERRYNSETGYPENSTDSNNGLTLPLFHLNGTANINVDSSILFDNVNIGQ